jgi:hypothetical protein
MPITEIAAFKARYSDALLGAADSLTAWSEIPGPVMAQFSELSGGP